MTVLRPEKNTAEAVKALRNSFLRRALAPAGIWTVETGTLFAGLHLNVLSPAPLHARWRNCETYSELLRTTARDAAAYIAKRSGMPPLEQFDGRLYGAFGHIGEFLKSEQALPVVRAAAFEHDLSEGSSSEGSSVERVLEGDAMYRADSEEGRGWKEGNPVGGRRIWYCTDGSNDYTWKPPRPILTAEERAAVMRKHLPNLYAIVGKRKDYTTVKSGQGEEHTTAQ